MYLNKTRSAIFVVMNLVRIELATLINAIEMRSKLHYRPHPEKQKTAISRFFVDLVRLELTTLSMPLRCAPSCATGPFFSIQL